MTDVLITENDGIVEIRLNRPDKKNALLGAMYLAMVAALEQASASPAARAVLFSAEGDAFSAGNDIGDFLKPRPSFEASPPARFIHAIAAFDKPMVAAVQGLAVGVGATMLLHCDLVYAGPRARLSMPFVDMGLVPEAGASLLVPMRIGAQRAAALMLLGEPMEAEAALTAGLVNAIVPAADLREHARAKARVLAAKPPHALAAARRLLRGDRAALEAHMHVEEAAFAAALAGDEARKAFLAFMAARTAKVA